MQENIGTKIKQKCQYLNENVKFKQKYKIWTKKLNLYENVKFCCEMETCRAKWRVVIVINIYKVSGNLGLGERAFPRIAISNQK
jgi:hypothetical protein